MFLRIQALTRSHPGLGTLIGILQFDNAQLDPWFLGLVCPVHLPVDIDICNYSNLLHVVMIFKNTELKRCRASADH